MKVLSLPLFRQSAKSLSRVLRGGFALLAVVLLKLVLLHPAAAATGVDWVQQSPANANNWFSVTYGKGLFVAVAYTGTAGNRVMTSPDGVTWTAQTPTDNALAWRSVAYGNSLFVAVSSTTTTTTNVMTSPDGVAWSGRTPPSPAVSWRAIAFGNNRFVTVSSATNSNRVGTSTDGITWTTPTVSVSSSWWGITYGEGRFVAVTDAGAATSTDGTTWEVIANTSGSWRSVAYGNGQFVAVGLSGNVMTSPDGLTWTRRNQTGTLSQTWHGVAYGSGLFVAVAQTAGAQNIMTSPDGITWTLRTSSGSAWNFITYGRGRFVAVGSGVTTYSGTDCGDGVSLTTGQWQQFATPCVPSAAPASVANVVGNAPTANFPSASYNSQWVISSRNAANNGNTRLVTSSTLANGAGYWLYSNVAPVNGKVTVAGTAATVTSGITGCQSLAGCIVLSVPTGTSGARMFGNPFGYDVEWSNVRIRVGGEAGTVYTPSEAATAGYVSKQIWIWNGAGSYDTWDDSTTPGNLQYSKSFFIGVLSGGVGQTIDLLIPATSSTLTLSSLTSRLLEQIASASRAVTLAVVEALIPSAHAQEPPAGWRVKLKVENPAKKTRAQAVLGQFPGSVAGHDGADLNALAPFSAPYLSLVFPRPDWGARKGDYATDFRAFDGAPGTWPFDVRTDTTGSKLILRWEGDPQILRRSRLIDPLAGLSIDPTDPAYAGGYPLTLTTANRGLRWEYLGN